MPDRGVPPSLEAQIVALFHQACAEYALDGADRLLSILEFLDHQRSADSTTERGAGSSPLDDAYRSLASAAVPPRRKH